jgi:hypothetical protein
MDMLPVCVGGTGDRLRGRGAPDRLAVWCRTGYQYPARLKHFLRVILLAAAGYSRSFQEHSDDNIYRQLAMAYLHSVKFLMKPVKKSERLTQQFAEADIKFVKVPAPERDRLQSLPCARACLVPELPLVCP